MAKLAQGMFAYYKLQRFILSAVAIRRYSFRLIQVSIYDLLCLFQQYFDSNDDTRQILLLLGVALKDEAFFKMEFENCLEDEEKQ